VFLVLCAVILIPSLAGSTAEAAESWTLATADTRISIAAVNNRPLIKRLECPRARHNWAGKGMIVPLLPVAAVDGEEKPLVWMFRDGRSDSGSGTLTLSFINADPRLVLKSIWRARPGRGPVEHWIEIENLSGKRVMVTHQDSLALIGLVKPSGLPVTAQSVKKGGTNATVQGATFFEPAGETLHKSIDSNPEDGASYVPFLRLQVGERHGLYVGWEFSALGGVRVDGSEKMVDVRVGNRPDFRTDVEPGEVFLVPAAFVGCYLGDADEGSYSLTRFVAEKLVPPVPEGHAYPTVTWNPYADTGMHATTEASLLPSIKLAGELGFETFVVDASWYSLIGDWRWDSGRFPRGGKVFSDYSRELGMDYGIWCAWGQGGSSEHPDAMSVCGSVGRPELFRDGVAADWKALPGWISGQQLCFGCPEAVEWAKQKTPWLVHTYGLDFLKHDCSPIVTTCKRDSHRHRYGVDVSYWATMGYYEVMDNIRRQCPNVVLENCSGGGIIKDFGALRRAHYTCSTDVLQSLVDRHSAWDTTWVLPPSTMMLYTYDNTLPVPSDKPGPFLWRSGMMASWVCAPTNTAGWTESEKQSVKRAVEVYKWWIRPILQDCKVLHIMPRPTDKDWDGLFYWSPGLRQGIVFIFRPDAPNDKQTVKLNALDRRRKYWVWSEDGSLAAGLRTGGELTGKGLALTLTGRYLSDLIYVQDASLGKPEGLETPGEFGGLKVDTRADSFAASASVSWQPSARARSYRVVVSDMQGGADAVCDFATTETQLDIPRLPAGATLSCSVEAVGWGGRRRLSGDSLRFVTPKLKPLTGVVFVSDLPWTKETCGSTVVRRDQNYLGQPLSIARKHYPKGVWTHAFDGVDTPADVTVDISGKGFARFVGDCGIDGASQAGTVLCQVLVDGAVKAESGVLRKNESHSFDVDVRGAGEVTFRVLNGGDGNACDHAAWGLARFVVEGSEDPLR